MKTNSDPREWYRQEELACESARRKMQPKAAVNLAPMYFLAGLIAAGVIYLLLILAGVSEPFWQR